MITINNNFSGASYSYTNENGNCTASGEYRKENDVMVNISINGQIVKDEKTYNFWANRDAAGNINVSGVPSGVLPDVANEVAAIVDEISNVKDKK